MDKILDWSKKILWYVLLLLLLSAVIYLWLYMPFRLSYFFSDIKAVPQLGDRFEAVNALFAGLAFAGVIFAIILQWKELGLQRQELKDTRAEIRGQKETLQKQNFESSFFQLLGVHNANVNAMSFQGTQDIEIAGLKYKELSQKVTNKANVTEDEIQYREYCGRDCFGYILQGLRNIHYEYSDYQERSQKEEEFLTKVGHYFRHLYHVVKFVDDQKDFPKDFEEKKRYTDFIHAQLSNEEFCVLLYLGRGDQGAPFKALVEEYSLFENRPSEVLIVAEYRDQIMDDSYMEYIQKLRDLYAPGAYGESE